LLERKWRTGAGEGAGIADSGDRADRGSDEQIACAAWNSELDRNPAARLGGKALFV